MSVLQRSPEEAIAQRAARPDVAPQRLHHLAYVTRDTEATAAFYSGVLGLPLVNAVIDDHVPSTKEALPFIHSFFRLGTGETIAFFEAPTLPPPTPHSHPAYRTLEHLALEVPTRGDVETWRAWLIANGIEVITNDHGSIYSIYFRDPVNDIRLEITASIAANWNAKEASARVALDEWIRTKRDAHAAGKDATGALGELAVARSRARRAARPPA